MAQHLECRCRRVRWKELIFPSEGKPKADLLEEQIQKGQIQTLLGHVRGLNRGQEALMADGDVQLGSFHQLLQRGDGGSLLGGFL